jgi:transmembrane sensor
MNERLPPSPNHRAIEREAAAWVVREERGLTPGEQDALSHWLAADPRHGEILRERRWAWREFDRIAGLPATLAPAPDPDLLAPHTDRTRVDSRRRRAVAWVAAATAAAAAIVLTWVAVAPRTVPTGQVASPRLSTALAAPCEERTLEDGSRVQLNRGTQLSIDFTAGVRRVRLERGEAHFVVAKNPERPFIVEAGGVTVRAVGTAFTVHLTSAAGAVVVAEGRVAVGREAEARSSPPAPVLDARQRVVVPLRDAAPVPPPVTLSEAELATRLDWQPRMLDFADVPLATIAAELNRRNPVQLIPDSAALRELRVNASIRSDNVEGFVRLLESSFDLRAEWRSETEIVLRRIR